jgi:phosphoribosylanthranilate isomerase
MLKTKVKASGISNLTDARYFAAREVEWLGFPIGAGISVEAAKSLMEWVDGVKIVGEFDLPTAAEIQEAQNILWFDAVQVGMFTPLEELAKVQGISLIKHVTMADGFSQNDLAGHFRQYAACCDTFLLDLSAAGISWHNLQNDQPFPLDFLKQLFEKYQTILAIDGLPDGLGDLLKTLQPYGLSLKGGEEEKTGIKSFDELDDILDALEITE